jgi:hypothetical protein
MISYLKYGFIFLFVNLFADVNFTIPATVPTPNVSPNLSVDGGGASVPQITTDASGQYVYTIWQKSNGTNNIIQTARSSDFGVTWVNPSIVTGTSVPNLSLNGQNASSPQIAIDASGKYVYAVWQRSNGTNNIVQTARSFTFGDTWVNPVAVTGSSIPNLSLDGRNAQAPQITTDASGQYVYAIWQRSDGAKFIIQTAHSSDFGASWINPSTITGSSIPNLSLNGQNASVPQITTDASGKYVYALWQRSNGTNGIIQTARSSDFGFTWNNPAAVTGSSIPNLSLNNGDADIPQITTDASGKYVYAIWARNNGINAIIQTARSSDFGVTWVNPAAVTGSSIPNLSLDGFDADLPQITTNASGQYVYAIWLIFNGINIIVQTARSSDFGVTWVNPASVTGSSIPNLSLDGGDAFDPQITTDASGQYVYAVWEINNGTNIIIQAAASFDFGVTWVNPTTVTGSSVPNLSLNGQDAFFPHITTDASGQYVYATWTRNNGIQAVNGFAPRVRFPITMVPKN